MKTDEFEPTEADLAAEAEQVWLEVDHRVKNRAARSVANGMRPEGKDFLRDWKTVRVFISSTFKDFQNEREILVKHVFPELRTWCRKRRVHLYECDLRWGVLPEDSHRSTKMCLAEIDNCMKYNCKPFFINLLSQRVGLIPRLPKKTSGAEKTSEETKKTKEEQRKLEEREALEEVFSLYGELVEGLSVTEMEIVHGAYSLDNPNALFMIRGDEFVDLIKAKIEDKCAKELLKTELTKEELKTALTEELKSMQWDDRKAKAKNDELKKKIRDDPYFKNRARVCKYACTEVGKPPVDSVKCTAFNREKKQWEESAYKYIRLNVESTFRDAVTEFLEERIADSYPMCVHEKEERERTRREREGREKREGKDSLHTRLTFNEVCTKCQPMSIYDKQNDMHHAFMQWKQETFVGREDALKEIKDYVEGSTTGSFTPLLVIGEAGVGKSALMAKVVKEMLNVQDDPDRVFFHFVGAVSRSTESKMLQQRIVKHLLKIEESDIKHDDDLRSQVYSALSKEHDMCRIVVIDAINQLNDDDVHNVLSWIPKKMSVKCILSVVPNCDYEKQLIRLYPLRINPLSKQESKKVAENYLRRFGKSLDKDQYEMLFDKPDFCNPLWLTTACEELRVFGFFRGLDDKVENLPGKLSNLLMYVLERLENQSQDVTLLKAALCLIEISRHGLLENELTQILGYQRSSLETFNVRESRDWSKFDPASSPLEAFRWANIYKDLSIFIRPFGDSGEGELKFHHQAFSGAVRERYINKGCEHFYHQILASYFYHDNEQLASIERKIQLYPHHAVAIGDYANLERFLSRWSVIETAYKSYPNFCAPLVKGWQQVNKGTKDAKRMRKKLIALPDAVAEEFEKYTMIAHILCHAADYDAAKEPARRALRLAEAGSRDYVKAKFLLAEVLANSTRWNKASEYKHVPVMREACKLQKEALDELDHLTKGGQTQDDPEPVMRLKGLVILASYYGFLAAFKDIIDSSLFVKDKVNPDEATQFVENGLRVLEDAKKENDGQTTTCYSTFELDCLMAEGRLRRGDLDKSKEVWEAVRRKSVGLLGNRNNYENVALLNEAMNWHDEGRKLNGLKNIPAAKLHHVKAYELYSKYHEQIVDIYGYDHQKCRACRGYMQRDVFKKLIESGDIVKEDSKKLIESGDIAKEDSKSFSKDSQLCCLM